MSDDLFDASCRTLIQHTDEAYAWSVRRSYLVSKRQIAFIAPHFRCIRSADQVLRYMAVL